ncbi:hypothetical protein L218DRAFT_966434, partial [Marasmius fiardii PR-910]
MSPSSSDIVIQSLVGTEQNLQPSHPLSTTLIAATHDDLLSPTSVHPRGFNRSIKPATSPTSTASESNDISPILTISNISITSNTTAEQESTLALRNDEVVFVLPLSSSTTL